MHDFKGRQHGLSMFLSLLLIIAPAVIFYFYLFRTVINMPFGDDYDGILGFLIHWRALHGFAAKALYILTAQHNEYKLILENCIFILQYMLLGHVNFIGLCILGNFSIALMAVVLWKMFLPSLEATPRRIALFIPVSWLLFQLSYAETLDWAAPCIQNLYIVVFAFAAFGFLSRHSRKAFLGALVSLVLAVTASPNAFIAAAIGLLMLIRAKRYNQIFPWVGITLALILLYAYRYDTMSSQSPRQHSVFVTLMHLNFVYIFSFLGATGTAAHVLPHLSLVRISVLLGIGLLVFFVYHRLRGRLSASPAISAAILFIIFTAVGVAGLRSDFGIDQSLSMRYRIYSSLLLVLVWFVVAEQYLQASLKPLRHNWFYLTSCVLAILLSHRLDRAGIDFLNVRRQTVITGMQLYLHPPSPDSKEGPAFTDGRPLSFSRAFNFEAREYLRQATEAGIYRPPS